MSKAFAGLCLAGFIGCAQAAPLVVLQDTGRVDHGSPVVTVHPDAKRIEAALNRGFAARLLRLDQMVQHHLYAEKKAPAPEPDYLVLGDREGGFPEQGFVLNGKRQPLSRWVDLPQSQILAGNWGAMDQIFPHELAHVVMARLAPVDAARVPVQIHAIGVRTSPAIAYQEGFGEHVQILAMDDPAADPATKALLQSPYWQERATGHLAAYRHELEAGVSFGSPMRLTFPLWYSNDEQVLRYYAVKENAFARKPASTSISDPYRAYLADRALPGTIGGEARSPQQMMAIEGVVSHIFWRWVRSPEMGRHLAAPEFYASYGTDGRSLDPVENMYLKIFAAAETAQAADLPALIREYKKRFPEDAAPLDALVKEALLGQALPAAPSLWIVNPAAKVGTSLFDQWRGLPRPDCFDLNAADATDLAGIPGISAEMAKTIQSHTPYASFEDLPAAVRQQLQSHAIVPRANAYDEKRIFGNMQPLLFAYLERMLVVWMVAATLGALALRLVEPWGPFRAVWRALLATGLALPLAWMAPLGLAGGVWLALIPTAIPTALWRLRRNVAMRLPVRPALRRLHPSLRGVLAWTALLLPAWLLVQPW